MSDRVDVPMGTTRAGITNFEHWDLIPIKQMVENSRPERMDEVADHWMSVKRELDTAARELKAATDHIAAHWEGSAADGFAQRSAVLQESISNTGLHAENTSHALRHASRSLQAAKTEMASIHVPSTWEKAKDKLGDGSRSDTQFRADVAAGMDRDAAVQRNSGSLSLLEERHQQAIAVMERLAPQYKAASNVMVPPDSSGKGHLNPIPSPPKQRINSPGDVGPAPKSPRGIGGGTESGDRRVSTRPTYRDPGSVGDGTHTGNGDIGIHQTRGTPPGGGTAPPGGDHRIDTQPPSHTGIDSHGGGSTTPGTQVPGGIGSGTGGGSGSGGYGGGSAGGGVGSGSGYTGGGLPGGGYGGARGGSSTSSTGGRTGSGYGGGTTAGRTGAGGGSAAGQGRTGTGAGGMGGMSGMGGGRAGAGSRGSGLARRGGGMIGADGKRAGGAFTEGGSGLGRNRGNASANGRNGGAMPGAGAGGQRKKDKRGSRPDYLVEDEDTWTGGDGPVNPPVIE
ncbi:WXG100 family type VII secretion target [Streptomyces sp. NPDC001380]|uniref:WXG100 family type VII secretion target n=1 Tax=Streptomyces sp. NPDC001380 TaxID=3364566 RepID=UPI0036C3441B